MTRVLCTASLGSVMSKASCVLLGSAMSKASCIVLGSAMSKASYVLLGSAMSKASCVVILWEDESVILPGLKSIAYFSFEMFMKLFCNYKLSSFSVYYSQFANSETSETSGRLSTSFCYQDFCDRLSNQTSNRALFN